MKCNSAIKNYIMKIIGKCTEMEKCCALPSDGILLWSHIRESII